jgi:hypothetical protein
VCVGGGGPPPATDGRGGRGGGPPPATDGREGRGGAPHGTIGGGAAVRDHGVPHGQATKLQQGRGRGHPSSDHSPVDTSGGIADDVQGKQKRKRKD